jgi:hypothetical protein
MRLRKPAHRLKVDETSRLVAAFEALLASSDPTANYAFWASIHAHCCPHKTALFLPWHRAYIFQFEEALRAAAHDDELTLPYWDWIATPRLPDLVTHPSLTVPRFSDAHRAAHSLRLPDQWDVDRVMSLDFFSQFGGNNCVDGRGELENVHGLVHTWVGPFMETARSAAFDPVFWLHHSNVDRLWTAWQRDHPGEHPLCRNRELPGIPGEWKLEDVLHVSASRLQYDYAEDAVVLLRSGVIRVDAPLTFSIARGGRVVLTMSGMRPAPGAPLPTELYVLVSGIEAPIRLSLFGLPLGTEPDVPIVPVPGCHSPHGVHEHGGLDAVVDLSGIMPSTDDEVTCRLAIPDDGRASAVIVDGISIVRS